MIDVADKGKALLLTKESKCISPSGDLVSIATQTIFIKGLGGFGGKGSLQFIMPKRPPTKPDKIVTERISENTALLYRLTGDWNPIHADLDLALLGGY